MTITLPPQTEARLREKAALAGHDPAVLAGFLLTDLLDNEEHEQPSVADAVNGALLAAENGREKPLSVYLAEQRHKRGLSDTWPNKNSVTETAPGEFDAPNE